MTQVNRTPLRATEHAMLSRLVVVLFAVMMCCQALAAPVNQTLCRRHEFCVNVIIDDDLAVAPALDKRQLVGKAGDTVYFFWSANAKGPTFVVFGKDNPFRKDGTRFPLKHNASVSFSLLKAGEFSYTVENGKRPAASGSIRVEP